jgi:DNA-binding NarL/FixJ family response regulator
MWTFLDGLRWDLLADGVQVLMCGVILACLVHNQLRHKRLLATSSRCETAPVFSQEVLLQALRQQAEQALTSIRTAVESEQAKLQQLMDAAEGPWTAAAGPGTEISPKHAPFRLGDSMPFQPKGFENRYDGLGDLAAQGLTVRQIAAQTRLPAGEVELALHLQRQELANERQQ